MSSILAGALHRHLGRPRTRILATGVTLIACLAPAVVRPAWGLNFRSLGNGQDFGDLQTTDIRSEYRTISEYLLATGHSILLPGDPVISLNSLAGVDVLYYGAYSEGLNLSEASKDALRSFVLAGGAVILEAESGQDAANAANQVMQAVELGRLIETTDLGVGNAGKNAGSFTDAANPLLVSGAFDLRGGTFSTTQGAHLLASKLTAVDHQVLGTNGEYNTIVELVPYTNGGSIYFFGDPIFTDDFTRSGGQFYNPHNFQAFENLVAHLSGEDIMTPVRCDLNGDESCSAADIDLLSVQALSGSHNPQYDLNGDTLVTAADRVVWVEDDDFMSSYFGDANLDGEFSTNDLVVVFQAGEYEDADALNSGWATGDWNGDREFGTGDLVLAFQGGGFELGPRAAVRAVPEPSCGMLGAMFIACLCVRHRGR